MVACTHCGAEVPAGELVAGAKEQFCCHGCRSVWQVLHGCGLDGFYHLRETTGGVQSAEPPPEPGAASIATAAAATVEPIGHDLARVTWWIAGVHCAACVWLLERLPHVCPGVREARLHFGQQRLNVTFAPSATEPSAIAAAIGRIGYRAHPWHDQDGDRQRRVERRSWYARTAVAAAGSLATMHLTWSIYAGAISGDMAPAEARLFGLLSAAAALPVVVWSAAPFWRGALGALRAKRITVDVTTSAVIAAGYLISLVHLLLGSAEVYFDAIAMFIAFLLAGRLVFLAARDRVAASGDALDHLLPAGATRITATGSDVVPTDQLAIGDQVQLDAGERLPADGTVVGAALSLDAAVLTGEARAVTRHPGEVVHAGCLALSRGTIRVTAVGAASRVGQLIAAVQGAAADPSHRHRAADRLQAWFAPLVALIAAATLAGWWRIDPGFAWAQAVAVILVACPCALGLAAPLGYARALAAAADDGVLIRDAATLERLAGQPSHVVFDKTGTLTTGDGLHVTEWAWLEHGLAIEQAAVATAVLLAERSSAHPLAQAVAAAAAEHADDRTLVLGEVVERAGHGLETTWDSYQLRIGRPGFAGPANTSVSVCIALDDVAVAHLTTGEHLRPGIAALVAALHANGQQVHLASGDAAPAVTKIAEQVGIAADQRHARCTPASKADLVRALSADGGVIVLGDGINDAAALAAADVAIGLRGGLEAALPVCDVFVVAPDGPRLQRLLAAGPLTQATIRLNLVVSSGYNLIGVAAAVAGWWGPYLCAVAMPVSSLSVILLTSWRRAWPRPNAPD